MTLPDARRLYAVTEATWPAARRWPLGPWMIREGRGGGQRVSATTLESDFAPAKIADAERAMADLGQPDLFMIRAGEEALDAELATRGYRIKDPVVQYAAPVAELAALEPPPMSAFVIWPPLAIMVDLWAEGGIGPGRIDVMARVPGAKTSLLARQGDRPAGCAFVALDGRIAMVHALEISPDFRRKGAGANLMRAAARWAADQGADHLAIVVTAANTAANALYTGMGMTMVGRYHYRIRTRTAE